MDPGLRFFFFPHFGICLLYFPLPVKRLFIRGSSGLARLSGFASDKATLSTWPS